MLSTTTKRVFALLTMLLAASTASASDTGKADKSVTVAPLSDVLFYPQESASATTISRHNSRIVAQISAVIRQIPVLVGDQVDKGQTLAELDCVDANLGRDSATAQLSLAAKEADRARSLRKSSNIAEQNYNQAQTNLTLAQIGLRQAAVQVERCRVSAPYAGIVTDKLASVGELASPGDGLIQLVSTDQVELSAKIPPSKIQNLNDNGATVTFEFQNKRYPVKLRAVLPVLDPASHQAEVRFEFLDQPSPVGSTGRLQWQRSVPYIPADLLLTRSNQTGIFLLDGDTARFHRLPEARPGKPAISDLQPNSLFIKDGRFSLRDGDAVEVLD